MTAKDFGFATSGFPRGSSAGGPRPTTARHSAWRRISSRSCSRPATRRGRVRRPDGGRAVRRPDLDRLLQNRVAVAPLKPGWDATPAPRETADEASPRSAGGCGMRNAPELVEVDSDRLEDVLRRAERALDEKDAALVRAVF